MASNRILPNCTQIAMQNATATEEAEEREYSEFYTQSQFITGLILYPIFCIPGIIGNALTIIVLTQKTMRTSTNAFLSALAISDMIKLMNDLMYFIVLLISRSYPTIGKTAFGYIYPYAHFIFNLAACVSSWLIVSVAAERYLMVCHAAQAKTLCTRRIAIIVSAVIYTCMTILAIPSAIRYKTVSCFDYNQNKTVYDIHVTELWMNENFETAYNWIQNLLRSVIPFLVLIILNTYIINALRKTRANRRFSARNRITFMLIMVIVVFVVCITPDAIMSACFGLGYYDENLLVKGIREFTDTLLAVNAALNFVLYCLFNKVFREHFRTIFCHRLGGRRITMEPDESEYRRLSDQKNNLSIATKLTIQKTATTHV
ncbi:FMRFamide receptor-like [Octopus bimaculoides]|uniref:G-protein coupled receptors family 1 profile domain-containing protein n=1 Tax=Octopus bimaculoides TaxID=37653 RepID=A0A0L8GQM9_OCTBM|nr:FMRFamide receptor-like [Octopus bimaculoides]XP_052822504.1 FMRFamide receptor-like [Octopus bimaculoides]|eukprot:XP_014778916.1 PREDICTED: FMRFamide receptor-like [Octopus bimaculoides]